MVHFDIGQFSFRTAVRPHSTIRMEDNHSIKSMSYKNRYIYHGHPVTMRTLPIKAYQCTHAHPYTSLGALWVSDGLSRERERPPSFSPLPRGLGFLLTGTHARNPLCRASGPPLVDNRVRWELSGCHEGGRWVQTCKGWQGWNTWIGNNGTERGIVHKIMSYWKRGTLSAKAVERLIFGEALHDHHHEVTGENIFSLTMFRLKTRHLDINVWIKIFLTWW